MLWKSYIDFEIEQEEFGNTRNLYKRLLQRTQHVKVRTASWLLKEKLSQLRSEFTLVLIFLNQSTKHLLL